VHILFLQIISYVYLIHIITLKRINCLFHCCVVVVSVFVILQILFICFTGLFNTELEHTYMLYVA